MSYKKILKPHKPVLRWDKIDLLVFDCDGVLTGGRIIYDENGSEAKNFDAHDGMGFLLLRQTNIRTAVITGRKSDLLQRRCNDLKIDHVFQGVANKLECLKNLLAELDYDLSRVLYMGDDWNDIPVMFAAAYSVCPADAMDSIRELADHVTTRPGGRGAVRECIELVLSKKGLLDQAISDYLGKIS